MVPSDTFRQKVSRWLFVISIALLAYCATALVIAWSMAAHDGWMPKRWGEADGNHGPWRQFYLGRTLVKHALIAPLAAFIVAGAGWFARPAWKTVALLSLALITFFAVAFTHFWLID